MKWLLSSSITKRINGFLTYQLCAWVSLYDPVAVDLVLYTCLKDQFNDILQHGRGNEDKD